VQAGPRAAATETHMILRQVVNVAAQKAIREYVLCCAYPLGTVSEDRKMNRKYIGAFRETDIASMIDERNVILNMNIINLG
jgi:hypothetical protein